MMVVKKLNVQKIKIYVFMSKKGPFTSYVDIIFDFLPICVEFYFISFLFVIMLTFG